MTELLGSLDFKNRIGTLGLFEHLPPGSTLRDIETALESREVLGALHELISVRFVGDSTRLPDVRTSFELAFALALGHPRSAEVSAVAGSAFDRLDTAVTSAIDALQKSDATVFAQLQSVAASSLLRAAVEAVPRKIGAECHFEDPATRAALAQWEADYRRQVIAAHGHIVPPDFEQKRKVPMRSLYVPPRITPELGEHPNSALSIDDFRWGIDRSVLLGDPGGGKSTAADYVASESARSVTDPVPFVVVLRDFARDDGAPEISIAEYIETRCGSLYQCAAPKGAVEFFLLNGRATVIFDGLDELIDSTKRREITRLVELFSERYPLTGVLVTSRRVGYDQARLDTQSFVTFGLSGFEKADVAAYVENWFGYVEELSGDELESMAKDFIEGCRDVPDLTATPLMLSLMCIIYRGQGFIPRNRPAVYEHCATLLFEKWDSSRKIYVELRAATHVDNAVKHLAYWMLTNQAGLEAVSEDDLISETAEYLRGAIEESAERRKAAVEFVEFCRGRAWVLSEAGTTASGEALFKFTHRTFMEYFAAYELTRRSDGPESLAKVLLPRVSSQEWDVVGQLAVQISDKHSRNGAERIFTAMLGERRRRAAIKRDNVLAFIWRCLSFVPVSAPLVRQLAVDSLASSFAVRNVKQTGSGDVQGASIFEAAHVLPEMRSAVGDAVGSALRDAIASADREFAGYAHSLMFSWAAEGEVAPDSAEYWRIWLSDYVIEHRAEVLDSGPARRDAWVMALVRDLVAFSDFAEAAAGDGELLLDAAFRAQQEMPLGFAYLDWGGSALHQFTWRPPGEDWSMPNRIPERLVRQLREFGARCSATDPRPWMSRIPDVWVLQRDNAPWVRFDSEEDAHWGVWVLLVSVVEALERATDPQRVSVLSSAPGEPSQAGFISKLLEGRRVGFLDSGVVFDQTMFAFTSQDRVEFRDDWSSGRVSVLPPS